MRKALAAGGRHGISRRRLRLCSVRRVRRRSHSCAVHPAVTVKRATPAHMAVRSVACCREMEVRAAERVGCCSLCLPILDRAQRLSFVPRGSRHIVWPPSAAQNCARPRAPSGPDSLLVFCRTSPALDPGRCVGWARPGQQRLCLYAPRSPAYNYQPELRPESASRRRACRGPSPASCGFVSVAHRDYWLGFVLPAVGG